MARNIKTASNGRSRDPILSNNNSKSFDRYSGSLENDSSSQLEILKSLNSKLVKETVDGRRRIESLQEENIALESQLEKSNSEMEALQHELKRATEELVGLEVEKNLNTVLLVSQAYSFEDNIRGFVEVKEERSKRLEREVSGICRERDGIEWEMKKREREIRVLKERSEELMAALEREGDLLRKVSQENDGLSLKLMAKIDDAKSLSQEIIDLRTNVSDYESRAGLLVLERNAALKMSEVEKINGAELKARLSELENNLNENMIALGHEKIQSKKLFSTEKEVDDMKLKLESQGRISASRIAEMESIIRQRETNVMTLMQKVEFLEIDLNKHKKLLWTVVPSTASVLAAIALVGFWAKWRQHT